MGKRCFIYGAQSLAHGVCVALQAMGQDICGYVVTSREGNPTKIDGLPVVELASLRGEDCFFYIAVPEYLHEEIIAILRAAGHFAFSCIDAAEEYALLARLLGGRGFSFAEEVRESLLSGQEALPGTAVYAACSSHDRPLEGQRGLPRYLRRMQAGAALDVRLPFCAYDDVGENISCENRHYDELTVTYWVWKNCTKPVKGIAHYRRYLAVPRETMGDLLSGKVDVCLPPPFVCWPDTGAQYRRYNTQEAVAAMLTAIEDIHGASEREAAEMVLRGKYLYNYNMLVARAPVFDDYCAWMFPVLFRVQTLVPGLFPSGVHTRVCGHLGELLLSVYFLMRQGIFAEVHVPKVWLT